MDKSLWVYLLLSLVFGGWAAIMIGRNFAQNWRSPVAVVAAALGLALGVRFLHYALFDEPLLTLAGYAADAATAAALALLGFRWRRTEQMTTQYYWLYERTGPLTWRKKT
jgi:hypothetical protein